MGLLDRFRDIDARMEGTDDDDNQAPYDEEGPDGMVPADPIAEAIVGLLEPFLDPDDTFSGMLFAVARRYLGAATPGQLREVVQNLCQAADTLWPLCTPPIDRAVPLAAGPGDSRGGTGTEALPEPDRAPTAPALGPAQPAPVDVPVP